MGHFDDYLHSAASKIQKRYHGWKGRKDFSRIRTGIVKIQSQFLLPLSSVSGGSVCISISPIQFIGCKCLCDGGNIASSFDLLLLYRLMLEVTKFESSRK
ncbi:hypothetical protein HN51_028513 [Arachis hypogaea]